MLTFLRVLSLQRSRMSSGLGRGGMTGTSFFSSLSELEVDCSGMLSVGYKWQNNVLQVVLWVVCCTSGQMCFPYSGLSKRQKHINSDVTNCCGNMSVWPCFLYPGSFSPPAVTSPCSWSSCVARRGGRPSAGGIVGCSCGRCPGWAADETCCGCF